MVSEKLFYAENKEDAEKDAKEWADKNRNIVTSIGYPARSWMDDDMAWLVIVTTKAD